MNVTHTDDTAHVASESDIKDMDEQFHLGLAYDLSDGVPQDDKKAFYYYSLASKQGHPAAQCNIGRMYGLGRGVPQDDTKAIYYYELAAKQGYAQAQCNIGARYYHGKGFPQDYLKAAHYYELAAKQGHAVAHCNLAGQYFLHEGVPKNYVKAYAHAIIAYALDSSLTLKEIIEQGLTSTQREEAEALAAEMWEELPE